MISDWNSGGAVVLLPSDTRGGNALQKLWLTCPSVARPVEAPDLLVTLPGIIRSPASQSFIWVYRVVVKEIIVGKKPYGFGS